MGDVTGCETRLMVRSVSFLEMAGRSPLIGSGTMDVLSNKLKKQIIKSYCFFLLDQNARESNSHVSLLHCPNSIDEC